MKTIKPFDVKQVPVEELRPGMVVTEGVVIRVYSDQYETVSGTFWVEPGDDARYRVAVYAKITETMLDHLMYLAQQCSARQATNIAV